MTDQLWGLGTRDPDVDDTASLGLSLSRLVYLVPTHRITIPRPIADLLPHGAWLSQLHRGISGGEGVDLALAQKAYLEGKELGEGSREEAQQLIAMLVEPSIETLSSLSSRLSAYALLERWVKQNGSGLGITESTIRLGNLDPEEVPEIEKWASGFEPVDIVTGGLYQGLVMVMGRPGTGKTSILLSIAESLVAQDIRVTFVQNELSEMMVLGKMLPQLKRTKWSSDDLMICSPGYSAELFSRMAANPDPNRVVIFDSPDAAGGGGDDGSGRRFVLEEIYRDMVELKHSCKAVIVSSQPRRRDPTVMMDSVAESWAKAWYSDIIIGIDRAGPVHGTEGRLRMRVVKNRHGPNLQEVTFNYDYVGLRVSDPIFDPNDDSDVW